jgi:hypothetical protein
MGAVEYSPGDKAVSEKSDDSFPAIVEVTKYMEF